jgi:hypothetical protein
MKCSTCGSGRVASGQGNYDSGCPACNKGGNVNQIEPSPQEDYIELSFRGWRNRFYAAYERGDLAGAERARYQCPYPLTEATDTEQAYQQMKRQDLIDELVKYTVWGLLGAGAVGLIAYINR